MDKDSDGDDNDDDDVAVAADHSFGGTFCLLSWPVAEGTCQLQICFELPQTFELRESLLP